MLFTHGYNPGQNVVEFGWRSERELCKADAAMSEAASPKSYEVTMSENADQEIGISFSDIFWRLWQWRGLIVFVPMLFAGAAALFVVFSALGQSRHAIYLVSLRNIENQHYPNGSEFSPRDLLIPEVLSEIRRIYEIPGNIDLNEAISVAYDSPVADGIAKSYQQRLSARNLTQAEIEALNQSYLQELRGAMRSALRITVDYPALGLDSERGLALAADLPRLWTAIYTTKYRIFTDRGLADLAVTRTVENLESTTSILVANNRLRAMVKGIGMFLEDNRLSMLRGADGISPADLLIEMNNFDAIHFSVLKSIAFQAEDAAAHAYMNRLRLDISEKKRQIQAFESTLSSLGDYQRSRGTEQVSQRPAAQAEQPSSIQIGDSTFSSIVELAERGSYVELVRRVLDERRGLMIELAALEREQQLATSGAKDIAVSPAFISEAAASLNALTGQYSQMLRSAEEQLRTRGGELFEPLIGPRLGGSPLLSLRSLLIVAAAGLAGLLLTVVGVLIAGSRTRSQRSAA